MNEVKKITNILITSTLFLIAVSIFIIYKQNMNIKNLSCLLGFSIIIEGFLCLAIRKFNADKYKIFNYYLHYGLATILIGLIVILNIGIFKMPLNSIIGVYFIFGGLIKFSMVILSNKISKQLKTITIINSILSIIFSLLMFINPFASTIYVAKTIGIFMLIHSILLIMNYSSIRKNSDKFVIKSKKTAKGK